MKDDSCTHLLESSEFPFYISPYLITPDWYAPHSHEVVEFVFVVEGMGEHVYNGCRAPYSRGDLFIIHPHIEHSYSVHGRSPLEVYNVWFLPSLLESELHHLAQVTPFVNFFCESRLGEPSAIPYHLKLDVHERLETQQLLERIYREFTAKGLGYQLSIKAMLLELFISLSRAFEGRFKPALSASRDETAVLEQVCAFTRQHYARPIMMEQIYQMSGMRASNFTAKFKQYTGKTFTEFRNEIRIGAARSMLQQTDRKILEIALEVGFEDISHFNKVFKQRTGLTPSRFRYAACQREAVPAYRRVGSGDT